MMLLALFLLFVTALATRVGLGRTVRSALPGLRGEDRIAELCQRAGVAR